MKKILTIGVFVSSLCAVLPGFAFADGLKVQPALIEEKIDPGSAYSGVITVTNIGGQSERLYVVVRDVTGVADNGVPLFAKENAETGYSLASWVHATEDAIEIGPNGARDVLFTIEVPKGAGPGGHFAGIFFVREADRVKTTGSGVGFEVGTIVTMKISGDIREEAEIREFTTNKNIYGTADVIFTTNIENLGNVLIRPRGPIDITDMFGKKVATLIVNDPEAGVFPKTIREFAVSWSEPGFYFGRYEAVMSLAYGEENGRQTVSRSISFWILPLKFLISVFGGLLLLVLFLFVFIRLHIKRKIRQIQEATLAVGEQRKISSDDALLPYGKESPISRLWLVTVVLLLFTLVFLAILFFLFA